jgi:Putative zinc-finger
MDHQEAIGLSAVERYLLGELSPLERDDFEEHFFGCHECATEVRITSQFLDGARRELSRGRMEGSAGPSAKPSALAQWLAGLWRPAFLAPVAALLLFVVGYQNFLVYPHMTRTLAQLRQPAVLSPVSLIAANSRAGGHLQVNGTANQPVLLAVDIPAEERFGSYVCELMTADGHVLWQVPVSSSQAHDTVSIAVPAGTLRSGDYFLVVKGLSSGGGSAAPVDLARYPFALQFPSTNQP